LYSIASKVMVDRARRRTSSGQISENVKAVLVFYKYLIEAVLALPDKLRFHGVVYRGLKWVFPSPGDHDPNRHFPTNRKLMWFEPKSTTTEKTVLSEDTFCGHTGPRTVFEVQTNGCAWQIHHFSYYGKEEGEVLTLPLSVFRVDSNTKQCIPDGAAMCGRQSFGAPDWIKMTMLHHPVFNFNQRSEEGGRPSSRFRTETVDSIDGPMPLLPDTSQMASNLVAPADAAASSLALADANNPPRATGAPPESGTMQPADPA